MDGRTDGKTKEGAGLDVSMGLEDYNILLFSYHNLLLSSDLSAGCSLGSSLWDLRNGYLALF